MHRRKKTILNVYQTVQFYYSTYVYSIIQSTCYLLNKCTFVHEKSYVNNTGTHSIVWFYILCVFLFKRTEVFLSNIDCTVVNACNEFVETFQLQRIFNTTEAIQYTVKLPMRFSNIFYIYTWSENLEKMLVLVTSFSNFAQYALNISRIHNSQRCREKII